MDTNELKGHAAMLTANVMWGLMSPVAKLVFLGSAVTPFIMVDVRIVGGVRAVSGEKVLVKIINYPEGKKPEGEILEVLGRSGELSAEEDALIAAERSAP